MTDLTIDVIVPKPPIMYCCKTVDCPVILFNAEHGSSCPGCWYTSISVVKHLQYTMQEKDV